MTNQHEIVGNTVGPAGETAGDPAPRGRGGWTTWPGQDSRDPLWLRQPLDESGKPLGSRRARRWAYACKLSEADRSELIRRARMQGTTCERFASALLSTALAIGEGNGQ